jgi:hypothetical protein
MNSLLASSYICSANGLALDEYTRPRYIWNVRYRLIRIIRGIHKEIHTKETQKEESTTHHITTIK